MVMGRPDEVRHPLLKKLKTAKKLIRFIQESGDRQWASRVSRVESNRIASRRVASKRMLPCWGCFSSRSCGLAPAVVLELQLLTVPAPCTEIWLNAFSCWGVPCFWEISKR